MGGTDPPASGLSCRRSTTELHVRGLPRLSQSSPRRVPDSAAYVHSVGERRRDAGGTGRTRTCVSRASTGRLGQLSYRTR